MTDQEKLYQALIGFRNTGYYMSYFARADERGYPPISWNWPAFFVGLIWLVYRRNYRWALIYFVFIPAVVLTTSLLSGIIGVTSAANLQLISILLFQAAYFPLHANGIYYKWALAELEKARKLHPGNLEKQIDHLTRTGGGNLNMLFLALTIMFVVLSLINSLPQASG